jgi:hypothetical protein
MLEESWLLDSPAMLEEGWLLDLPAADLLGAAMPAGTSEERRGERCEVTATVVGRPLEKPWVTFAFWEARRLTLRILFLGFQTGFDHFSRTSPSRVRNSALQWQGQGPVAL